MPRFRIFHLKEQEARKFRESAPKEKPYHLRQRHYEEGGEVEAASPYAVWKKLQEPAEERPAGERELSVGDAVEEESSGLVVLNYWGFDEARWLSPEATGTAEAVAGAAPGEVAAQDAQT